MYPLCRDTPARWAMSSSRTSVPCSVKSCTAASNMASRVDFFPSVDMV